MLIPSIPLSFQTLSINRSDGSCTPHYRGQSNFAQLLQTQQAHGQPEINRNVDVATPVSELQQPAVNSGGAGGSSSSCSTAGVPINEQMSRSMHEARNHIFEEQQQQHFVETASLPPVAVASPPRQRRMRPPRTDAAAAVAASAPSACQQPAGLPDPQSPATSSSSLPPPQIAFAMDPSYNVLWVFDGVARKLRCHNVIASEISEFDVVSGIEREMERTD